MKYLKKIFEAEDGKTGSQTPTRVEQLEMVENVFINDVDEDKCVVEAQDEKDYITVYLSSLIDDEDYDDCTDLASIDDVDRLIVNAEIEIKAYKKLKMYLTRLEYKGFIYEINAEGLQEVIIKIRFLESEEPNIFEYLWDRKKCSSFGEYNKSKLKQIFKRDYDINITTSYFSKIFDTHYIHAFADRILDDEVRQRILSDAHNPRKVSFNDNHGTTMIQIEQANILQF